MSDKVTRDLWLTCEQGETAWWESEPEARIVGEDMPATRISPAEYAYVEFAGAVETNPEDLVSAIEDVLKLDDGQIARVSLTIEVIEGAHEAWTPGADADDAAYDRMKDDMIEGRTT